MENDKKDEKEETKPAESKNEDTKKNADDDNSDVPNTKRDGWKWNDETGWQPPTD